MTRYFTPDTFKFLNDLALNNNRPWFNANKARYEDSLRQPFLRLIGDLAEPLARISPHFVADPRPVGGSLFRIHRDARFSSDKSPYKTNAGARLRHERGREVAAPVFYLHLQPGNCFLGGGIWHPETATLRHIREFIFDNPAAWQRAVKGRSKKGLAMGGDSLSRPPRGFPVDHPLVEDLKRKDFVASLRLPDSVISGPNLVSRIEKDWAEVAPLIDYLCAALDLPF